MNESERIRVAALFDGEIEQAEHNYETSTFVEWLRRLKHNVLYGN